MLILQKFWFSGDIILFPDESKVETKWKNGLQKDKTLSKNAFRLTFRNLQSYCLVYQLMVFIRDLSFGILFIWKLHQIHFVFLLILLGYQSLFYTSSLFSSQDLVSIGGKEFTSHRIQILILLYFSLILSLVFTFGSEIY